MWFEPNQLGYLGGSVDEQFPESRRLWVQIPPEESFFFEKIELSDSVPCCFALPLQTEVHMYCVHALCTLYCVLCTCIVYMYCIHVLCT